MLAWLKRLGVYILLIWNIVLLVAAVKMYSRISFLETQVGVMAENQKSIASAMGITVRSQESLLTLTLMHIELYYSVTAYLNRFHRDAGLIDDTRRHLEECSYED